MQCGNSSGLVGAQYAGLNIVCLAFGCVLLFYLFGVNNWGKKENAHLSFLPTHVLIR